MYDYQVVGLEKSMRQKCKTATKYHQICTVRTPCSSGLRDHLEFGGLKEKSGRTKFDIKLDRTQKGGNHGLGGRDNGGEK